MLEQILFLLVLGMAVFLVVRRAREISANIGMGRRVAAEGRSSARLRNMLLVAFGQKKMFKRLIPAILHSSIYIGFIVINIEVLEFMLDGLLGTHRLFAPYLGGLYTVLMNVFEFLAAAVLVSCAIMLIRRNVLKLPRFWSAEMTSWPRLDANIILITEILLMLAILTMNGADQVLQQSNTEYTDTGRLILSSMFTDTFESLSVPSLVIVERVAWWIHIVGILAFAVYITYSKHLHIFLAFPNTYFARIAPAGKINNMPVVTHEVRSMLGIASSPSGAHAPAPGRFGAKDVNDLSRTNLLSAYACTECGRCTAECPANLTGKKLSPRKIMMDTRDRMEEVRKSIKSGGPGLEDGKSLLGSYITKEEINACTSCNACVEACPVLINPLEIILELRRYVVMEESGSPASWNAMFQNIETSFAPWKFSPSDRFNWSQESKP